MRVEMEEEIDLREFIRLLLRNWAWVLGLALVAAIAALIVSSLLPNLYQASAMVAFVQPRYQVRLDSRAESANRWNPEYQAFAQLAVSDGILQAVVDSYAPSPAAATKDWRLAVLAGMVEASTQNGSGLIALKVRSRSANDAAALANVWADTLARRAKEIYGGSEQDVAFLEEQASLGAEALATAESQLVDFQARDQTAMIKVRLESLRQAQSDYLANQRSIATMVQDIQGLRTKLAGQPSNTPSSFADELTALLLQIKAFNAQTDAPIGLQIEPSAGSLSDRSLAEQIAFLDELVVTLQQKSAEIDRQLLEFAPQVLALQRDLQEATAEHDQLVRAQELARDKYLALARTLDESRIAAQEHGGLLQVISYAAIPETPISPRRLFNAAVAGLLGLMIGVFAIVLMNFWRGGVQDGKNLQKRDGEAGDSGGQA
jgi:uncharacterized protein involved in exopolysaccharide biosynthesis